MSPQEKAKELIDKFRPYVDSEIAGETNFEYSKEQETTMALKCALIVVDEIIDEIKVNKRIDWLYERKGGEEFLVYWYAVRDNLNFHNIVFN